MEMRKPFNTPQELRFIKKEGQACANAHKFFKKNLKAFKYWYKQETKWHQKFRKEYEKRNG